MKNALLFPLFGLAFVACQKSEESPADIAAPFQQAFALAYHQTAALPQQSSPELQVRLADLDDQRIQKGSPTYVPKSYVTAKLHVTLPGGPDQSISLCWGTCTTGTDSAAVAAPGVRYDIRLLSIEPTTGYDQTATKNKSVRLRITRR
ncbi:hypothetical protein [Hymenobacter ruricola]|uniref:Lipoprotein n=1 Tax=Hymenobacter ruricola TaxID=2791023 RepID=A0ABS0I3V8_9BACT|nr:hypothetical protein [Hymenobacter ruricola]MBF9221413.1 hypothetical protein [Hymenobacter ruricola]